MAGGPSYAGTAQWADAGFEIVQQKTGWLKAGFIGYSQTIREKGFHGFQWILFDVMLFLGKMVFRT